MCAHAREGGAEVKAEENAVEGVGASRLVRNLPSSDGIKLSVAYKAIAVAVADAVISGMHVLDSLEKCLTELIGVLVLTGRIPESQYLPSESERPSEMRATLADLRETFSSCYPDTAWKSGVGLMPPSTPSSHSEPDRVGRSGAETVSGS